MNSKNIGVHICNIKYFQEGQQDKTLTAAQQTTLHAHTHLTAFFSGTTPGEPVPER